MEVVNVALTELLNIFNMITLSLSQCYVFNTSLWQFLLWSAILSAVFAVVVGKLRF